MKLNYHPPLPAQDGELCPLCGNQATYAFWFRGNERGVVCATCQTRSFDLFMARINAAVARAKAAA